ncbi:MAG: hypothetical protein IH586_03090, partial [Anaerolineaceae bacterium]|nr:hypothetical protein [Anaerolineaceae bacterium]
GVSYMGHHNPKYLDLDLCEMKDLGLDDVLLAAQENDFIHFPGKLDFTPRIAREYCIRPLAIFWGALNLFGGGRSSQFLLENPSGFQLSRDGGHLPAGCYVNPLCVSRIEEMIDSIALRGFEGYFVDEPTPLRECYCPSCCARYAEWHAGDLRTAGEQDREAFRQQCVIEYVREISSYCKANHPRLETICCLMPHDDAMWQAAAQIPGLDNLGTDIYWVNETRDVEEMTPILRRMEALCRANNKTHHEWLQCWHVQQASEQRISGQGQILVRENPDALYVWAWKGQVGTDETCVDPQSAWLHAEKILRMAKEH